MSNAPDELFLSPNADCTCPLEEHLPYLPSFSKRSIFIIDAIAGSGRLSLRSLLCKRSLTAPRRLSASGYHFGGFERH